MKRQQIDEDGYENFYCEQCGNEVSEYENYCDECGCDISQTSERLQPIQ